MKTQSRLIICKDCNCWNICHNVELGICKIKQDEEYKEIEIENTTWYDTRCIYGLSEMINVPEIEVQDKEHK